MLRRAGPSARKIYCYGIGSAIRFPLRCSNTAKIGLSCRARPIRLFGASEMSRFDPIAGRDPVHDAAGAMEFLGPLPADLARAVGWLRGHLSEPVRLDILAEVAGVRPRPLETHFKTFLGTTPLGWVRRMRLARARQELVRQGADATV